MRNRRVLLGGGAIVATTALCAACTSLLGDFTASDTGGPGDDGGSNPTIDGSNDGTVGPHDAGADGKTGTDGSGNGDDGGGGVDAGQDAAAYLLHCAFSLPNPIRVESLEGQNFHFYSSPPIVAALNDSEAMILEPGEGGHYTVFWVRSNDKNQPVQGVYTEMHGVESNDGVVYDFKSVTGGVGVMQGFTPPGVFGPLPQFFVSTWASTDFGGNAPSNVEQISGHAGQNGGGSASFVETAPLQYAWAVTGNDTDGGNGSMLWTGLGFPDAGSIVSEYVGDTAMHGGNVFVVHDGNKLRLFMSSSPDQGSALEWSAPDDGTADGGVAARRLGPGIDAGTPAIVMGAGPAAGGANFAFIDIDFAGAIAATFHVGYVPSSRLDTFVADDIPASSAKITTPSTLPISNGRAAWFGDDFAMIGVGQPLFSGGGINFLWFDAQGHQRADQTGANALLAGHNEVDGVGIALAQKLGTLVSWHLAWSEQLPGADGGLNDVLFYQSVSCN